MSAHRSHYEVLGLEWSCSQEQIKARYYELAKRFHPDLARRDKHIAEQYFAEINVAYQTLRDAERRCAYDARLGKLGEPKPPYPSRDCGPSTQRNAGGGSAAQTTQKVMTVAAALADAKTAFAWADRKRAEELCEAILRADPNQAEAHGLLGDIYFEQRLFREALDRYRTAAQCGDNSRLTREKTERARAMSARPAASSPSVSAKLQLKSDPCDDIVGREPHEHRLHDRQGLLTLLLHQISARTEPDSP